MNAQERLILYFSEKLQRAYLSAAQREKYQQFIAAAREELERQHRRDMRRASKNDSKEMES